MLNALLDTVDKADTVELEAADLIDDEASLEDPAIPPSRNSEVVPKNGLEEDDLPEFLFGSQPPR